MKKQESTSGKVLTKEEIYEIYERNRREVEEELNKITPEQREKRMKSWERLVQRMTEEVS